MEKELYMAEFEKPKVQWVDLIVCEQGPESAKVAVRCILENGVVRVEGDESYSLLIAELKQGVRVGGGEEMVSPGEGKKFLAELSKVFRSVYLFATDVQSGDKIKEFELPPMIKAGEETESGEK